ncbi:MAG: ABC transporter ATP-binding protein/permease [Myxococcales bacterium]|nr:MAG: ABC transporter ATP-binding protein/permease [Myxococcales bacterium]
MVQATQSAARARATKPSLGRSVAARLLQAVRDVVSSEVGGRFRLMFGGIVALLVAISGLNVLSSYAGRDLMTAIEQRDSSAFFKTALSWLGVFACLTAAAVTLRFIEERLALLWREWLTKGLLREYLAGGVYLRLREHGELGNPDQRITDDARAFTATTLSVVLMLLNALLAILAFSGVMWSISPLLFFAAVGYAALGSAFTILFGRPLVRLNYDQSDREASFRSELVHLGENAESVAVLRLEGRLQGRLRRRLTALVANMRRIIAVNRNLGFFTTGYNYGIQLVPPLIVGPLFMHGKVEFGVITQSAMAFAHILGAFSLVVTQFQSLSSYAAVVARLGTFRAAMERHGEPARLPSETNEGPERLVYEDVTLQAAGAEERLVSHLTITVLAGTRLLVIGTDEARRALFRATALGRTTPEGRIVRPGPERILFLPERPYVPPGTLRELIVRGGQEESTDERVLDVLRSLGLEPAVKRLGGLDVEGDWGHVLSLGEQQLLAVARVLLAAPAFVVLQNPGTSLAPEQLARALAQLSEASISYLAFGGSSAPTTAYDAVLEIHADGTWSFRRS